MEKGFICHGGLRENSHLCLQLPFASQSFIVSAHYLAFRLITSLFLFTLTDTLCIYSYQQELPETSTKLKESECIRSHSD